MTLRTSLGFTACGVFAIAMIWGTRLGGGGGVDHGHIDDQRVLITEDHITFFCDQASSGCEEAASIEAPLSDRAVHNFNDVTTNKSEMFVESVVTYDQSIKSADEVLQRQDLTQLLDPLGSEVVSSERKHIGRYLDPLE